MNEISFRKLITAFSLLLATCLTAPAYSAGEFGLTVDFTGMTPHIGQALQLKVIDTELHSPESKSSILQLSLSGADELANGFHYEGWAIIDGMPVSTGKFNVSAGGDLVDLNGNPISGGEFVVSADLTYATAIIITLEPDNDPDPAPAATHILAGDISDGNAALNVGHAAALGDDFSSAEGMYILATPTNGAGTDENSGIWFLDLSSGGPEKGLSLAALPAGWEYEGWVVMGGVPVSTGKFTALDAVDLADPYSDTIAGPPFPGEDFLMSAPDGLTFPADLAGATAVISIEPSPDDSPSPFTLKPLTGAIPADATDHITYAMDNNSSAFLSGTARVKTYLAADTILTAIPAADFQIMLPGVLSAGRSYNVDFYADLNKNGIYDAPPVDHAWRLMVVDVAGDEALTFTHNVVFTDVMFPYMPIMFDLTVDFMGMTPHIGQKLQLRVIDTDLHSAESNSSILQLSFSGADALANGFHYEGWAIIGGMPVTTGKFNVSSSGGLEDLNGDPIAGGEFMVSADLTDATAIVITIEPDSDPDPAPAATHIFAGDISDGSATLKVGHASALGDDFSSAMGMYILATPTNGADTDENSGIWFLDLSSGTAEVGLTLAALPAGWEYEGWVVIEGVPVTTGRFTAMDEADFSDPYSSTEPGPPFPGEDFLINAPDGLTFPADIAGATAVISIEPSPDDSPAPFTLKPLAGMISAGATDHVTYAIANNASMFPTGSATIRTYLAADTTLSAFPAADLQLVIPGVIFAGRNYNVDFYADLNKNGIYDAPPADHAWRMMLAGVTGNEALTFTHNVNFTDIMFPNFVRYCDINGDGRLSMKDAIAFLLLAQNDPSDPRLDWDDNGVHDMVDVVYLLRDIWTGMCPENSAGSTMLASVSEQVPSINVDLLTEEEIGYLEQIMGQLELTEEQEAEFRAILYGRAARASLPKAFALSQNTPNPFNPATTISYSVPEGKIAVVSLEVYDIRGRLVASLVNQTREAGTYTVFWDAISDSGQKVASGVYFYRMRTAGFSQTRKMVLLK